MEAEAQPRPSALRIWLMATRPRTLTAALVPVAVGSAVAALRDGFSPLAALAALGTAVFLQIGTNLANDLFDFKKGADGSDRLGPTRVTQAGLVSMSQIGWATALAFALAFCCGLYLVAQTGWPLLVLGLVCILCGIIYTGGPFPLAYNALGDVFVFVFFGVVATVGTTYVQTQQIDPLAFWLSVPVGAHATAILIVNNTRDIVSDKRNNKITTAVLLGPQRARLFYDAVVLSAYVAVGLAVGLGHAPTEALLGLASLPLAVMLMRSLHRNEGIALNPILGKTAMLQLLTGLLLAAGVAWAA